MDKQPSAPSCQGTKGSFLIPPLPRSKLPVDKDGKARSPLGRSRRKNADFNFEASPPRGLGERENNNSNSSLSHIRKSSKTNAPESFHTSTGSSNSNRRALAPLPFPNSGMRKTYSSGDKQKATSGLQPLSRKPKTTMTTTNLIRNQRPGTSNVPKYGEPMESLFAFAAQPHATKLSLRKGNADEEISPKRRRTDNGVLAVSLSPEDTKENERQLQYRERKMPFRTGLRPFNQPTPDDRGDQYAKNHPSHQTTYRSDSLQSTSVLIGSKDYVPASKGSQVASGKSLSIPPHASAATSKSGQGETNRTSPFQGDAPRRRNSGNQSLSERVSRVASVTQDSDANRKRPPLPSKTPRLARVGLSGAAKRVDENSILDDSESDDSVTEDVPTNSIIKLEEPHASPAKMSKMDLAYIRDWNPTKKRNSNASSTMSNEQKTDDVSCTGTGIGNASLQKTVTRSYQSSPSSSHTGMHSLSSGSAQLDISKVSSTGTSGSSITDRQSGRESVKPAALIQVATTGTGEISKASSTGTASTSSSTDRQPRRESIKPAASIQVATTGTGEASIRANPDFLPLVAEENVINVNNVPYIKLGVIGKGGSSKVYRVLTKEYTVMAIKKVKLSDLDQKAIDGYANEIALLKRLKGNPAIVQMQDSEVDMIRKAIFVVMEVGEADLNHVLQRQQLSMASNETGRSGEGRLLDMNFLRLTWSQMLNAVHSIHEERIIHGDLKPANFLFVRGSLKLIDFGIAGAIQSEDTTNIYRESQIGTLSYMSPEAIMGTGSSEPGGRKWKCGRPSDIWSLGCILYQMVYGRTPFGDMHMIQKIRAIVDPTHRISFPNTVDEAAIDAMQQCLRREPQERPPIVGENGLLNEHRFLNCKS